MKNGYSIHWSDEAKNNLNVILSYLQSKWTEKEVRKFSKRLEKVISLISENPKLFPVSKRHPSVRRAVLTKHNSIYYRIKKNDVEIITIFDTRQDPNQLTI